jgi:hypothetical protein
MKTQTAQRVVIISAIITLGVGWFNSAKKGKPLPSWRFIIGGGMAFVILGIVADFEPEIAGPLALAVVTTALLTEGNGILEYANTGELTPPKPKQPAAPAVPVHTPTGGTVGQIPGSGVSPSGR